MENETRPRRVFQKHTGVLFCTSRNMAFIIIIIIVVVVVFFLFIERVAPVVVVGSCRRWYDC